MWYILKKPLHVLVVATWYPHGKDTLIGIYHKQFCEALANAGVKVNMLHVDAKPVSSAMTFPFKKKKYYVEEQGYNTYFRLMLNRRRFSETWQQEAYTKKLEKLYREYEAENGKPDIIHAQVMVPAGYACCVLGKKLGIPVIITEHATYYQRFFTGWYVPYTKYVTENADMITCVGVPMKEYLQTAQGVTARILPNIVDCSLFARPKAEKEDDVLRFVTVCAMRHGKNVRRGLEALAKLRKDNKLPPFRYTVVGDGYLLEGYKENAREFGISDCVDFVGQKTHEEIAEILSKSDIMLVNSDRETFCIPAIEATAAGVPVVSTKCGGPEGFLPPEASELCEVGDADVLADAILRMVTRLPEIKEEEVRAVAKTFDGAAVAAQAIAYYEELLKK